MKIHLREEERTKHSISEGALAFFIRSPVFSLAFPLVRSPGFGLAVPRARGGVRGGVREDLRRVRPRSRLLGNLGRWILEETRVKEENPLSPKSEPSFSDRAISSKEASGVEPPAKQAKREA